MAGSESFKRLKDHLERYKDKNLAGQNGLGYLNRMVLHL